MPNRSLRTPRRLPLLAIAGLLSVQATACDGEDDQDRDSAGPPITYQEIQAAQQAWGQGIVAIGNAKVQGGDPAMVAANHVDTLYAFGVDEVLFKPTKAAQKQFRLTRDEALSYFVGGQEPEDGGFALQPWTNVRFENAGVVIRKEQAVAMGNYYFTDAATGTETKVEYTFGYVRNDNGALVINVHHSSLPYSGWY